MLLALIGLVLFLETRLFYLILPLERNFLSDRLLDIVVMPSGNSGEEAIAFKVKKNALEKMVDIEDTITTPLDDLDFIIETLDKTTIEALDKIVGDVFKVIIKGGQESIKTS